MFAGEKKGEPVEGEGRACRVILSRIPNSADLRQLVVDLGTLAASAPWVSIAFEDGKMCLWSDDDQKGNEFNAHRRSPLRCAGTSE